MGERMSNQVHIRPTPKGAWPYCVIHPAQVLVWRRNGWGWRCVECFKANEATPQPWQPAAKRQGAVPITPNDKPYGRTPPADMPKAS
jgi:hypothetical protein